MTTGREKSRPNILFITVDQMRGDLMGCAGNNVIQTPHLDYLAKRGVRFTQACSTTPICIPARAMIMTGLDGNTLGCTYYKEGFELPTQETLPKLLGDAGYETRVVGKMHVYPERCHYGFDSMLLCEEGRLFGQAIGQNRGYDDYESWLAEQGYAGQAFAHGMSNNEFNMTPWHLPDHLHPTEWIGSEACKAIKRRDWTRPLFMWASFTAPHPPLTPLQRELALYDRDEMPAPARGDWIERAPAYYWRNMGPYVHWEQTRKQTDMAYRGFYALITQVDRQINRILGTLREQGQLSNTWIIFTSDHGDNLGDHGLWGKSNFFRGSCSIPLQVVPPAGMNLDEALEPDWMPGRTNDTPVGLQDLLPTMLAAAGASELVPSGIDGRSLLPLLRNPEDQVREVLYGEFGVTGSRAFMLNDGRMKYMWFEEDGGELLFDMRQDVQELHDLAAARPDDAAAWRERLAEVLLQREGGAVEDGRLKPKHPGGRISSVQLARMASDLNPRGLH